MEHGCEVGEIAKVLSGMEKSDMRDKYYGRRMRD
jgi:hypothetical protein